MILRLSTALTAMLGMMMTGAVAPAETTVQTDNGMVAGSASADAKIRSFKGIPYAAPPVGDLRWKAPQPAASWSETRSALEFGPRCMQGRIFDDMIFRDSGPSEDCLNLNVWTPAASADARLPVMVWIHGGGLVAGGTSEPRQDGENLARKGVVVVSMNYRMGIFGFLALPALTKESGHSGSGNYGLMDQTAALQWVKSNIAAFGGDPGKVTIFGESAGSMSVSGLMASPLSKELFQGAIGESGAFFSGDLAPKTLADAEAADAKFASETLGADSLQALRAKPAAEVLKLVLDSKTGTWLFGACIDGYFFPEPVHSIYAAGKQAHVPVLAGWNLDEGGYEAVFEKDKPTLENFKAWAKKRYGDKSAAFLQVYRASDDASAKRTAQDYAGDQFIAYGTWKWIEAHVATGDAKVFRYRFEDPTPPLTAGGEPRGAFHSSDIEFVFKMQEPELAWRPQDKKLSDEMATYWANFAKNGDPNGPGLPKWPAYNAHGYQVMHLNTPPHAAAAQDRPRYEFLEGATPEK